jgi:predicted nucleotidyltransferase
MRRRILPGEDRTVLAEALQKHLESRPEITCAYLHGSFLDGGSYRDVDVAVWVDPARCNTDSFSQYAIDLSTELSVALGQPVEVQVLNRAPLAFRYHALKGRPLLVRDREWLDELRARTWGDYFDFLPFSRQYLRELLGA